MKTSHCVGIMAMTFAGLGGCASTQPAVAVSQDKIVDDSAYVAKVEQQALRRGVSVRWVNVPHKRTGNSVQDQ